MKTRKRATGDIGEEFVCRFLKDKNYEIIERNYLKKWGEIDVIALNLGKLHFIEVKSISNLNFRPEDAVRTWKKKRMAKAIRTYFLDRKISDETDFQIDIAAVFLDFEHKKARIRLLENVILT